MADARPMTPLDVLYGNSVKEKAGTPVTLHGGRPPLQTRKPNAHHPNIDVADFDWKSYPDNDIDGVFQTSFWKLSFRSRKTGIIEFYIISSPGNKQTSPQNTDLLKAVKTYKAYPLEVSAGLWWYQIEKGDDWLKVDDNIFNPLDYRDMTDLFYDEWTKRSGIDKLDFLLGANRPKTDEQLAKEKDKAKDDELATLREQVKGLLSKK